MATENRYTQWIRYVLLFILWSGIAAWLWYENSQQQKHEEKRLRDQAQVTIETVASSIRAQSLLAMYHPERLQKTLDEVTSIPIIHAIAILDNRDDIVAVSGEEEKLQLPLVRKNKRHEIWSQDTLQVWSAVRIGKIPWKVRRKIRIKEKRRKNREKNENENVANKNPGELENVPQEKELDENPKPKEDIRKRPHFRKPKYPPASKFFLTVAVSTKNIHANTSRGTKLRVVIAVMSFLLLGVFGYVWEHSLSRLKLITSLEIERRKNQHLYEMNIAANGLAHETKNPLNSLRLMTQTLANDYPEWRGKLDIITNEVDRISSRINEWLAFSKQSEPKISEVKLSEVFAELKNLIAIDIEEKNIDFTYCEKNISVLADREMLRQLLFNLLLNSTQAIGEDGHLKISVIDNHRIVCISVEDNGPGVLVENQDKLFIPYFTTKEEGSGLGLAICKQIAVAHGWHIRYENQPTGGARFIIENIRKGN